MRRCLALVLCLVALPLAAAERAVPAGGGALAAALVAAAPGDVLILAPGRHAGPVVLNRAVTLDGQGRAEIAGDGRGSVVTITAPDVTVRGLRIRGSGDSHETIDSGVQLTEGATRARVEGNVLTGNLYGVDVHGARDALVAGNQIVGRQDANMNARGNGIYVWNADGARITGNDIVRGRDGIFANASRNNLFANNTMRDLRYAVHYMYTNDSEVSGNLSVGNHLGFALMYSRNIVVRGNRSVDDRDHGVMLNYTNSSVIEGNSVVGAGKCTFIYNAHKNRIADNRFEGCEIGIHFTAGSERNAITGNAFLGNREQVKYVGTRMVEWSDAGRGNFWSDHAAFDLDGDGIADNAFRPHDLMDHILWTQPAAHLLLGSPAVHLLRWSQAAFPALLPGGVVDSAPLMAPPPPFVAAATGTPEG